MALRVPEKLYCINTSEASAQKQHDCEAHMATDTHQYIHIPSTHKPLLCTKTHTLFYHNQCFFCLNRLFLSTMVTTNNASNFNAYKLVKKTNFTRLWRGSLITASLLFKSPVYTSAINHTEQVLFIYQKSADLANPCSTMNKCSVCRKLNSVSSILLKLMV